MTTEEGLQSLYVYKKMYLLLISSYLFVKFF